MKRNLLKGIILISAIALSSCSVNKTASNVKNNDDVYFSNAKAGEEPVYATRPDYQQEAQGDVVDDEDDYFYYDDYASRINRFSYYSPFGYYDYAYSPYGYNNFGFGLNYGMGYGGFGGFGLGIGYGGFGYGGFGYGGFGYGGFGYSPWGYGYSPYSFWGTGYGYGGGGGYWGGYSAYNRGNARPSRGNGNPNMASGVRTSYNGTANNGIGYYPGGRSVRNANGISVGRPGRNGSTINVRPSSQSQGRPQTYSQPSSVERSSSSPSSSSGGGGSRGGGGGGGGGRPGRP
jgi:hypothetical protein